jgi:hypothetical protein
MHCAPVSYSFILSSPDLLPVATVLAVLLETLLHLTLGLFLTLTQLSKRHYEAYL